ncbi:hypothetical protein AVEN_208255-1 [Araneus ventricosus]|uniref:Uncharacterized protein n=1 Tax=Araneus ventricosus TaxID=182803 RepID=A0A4Y2LTW6_ARAVE|nr:hypothetical protein AVEN_208255-1 [Araneus ventricosus]
MSQDGSHQESAEDVSRWLSPRISRRCLKMALTKNQQDMSHFPFVMNSRLSLDMLHSAGLEVLELVINMLSYGREENFTEGQAKPMKPGLGGKFGDFGDKTKLLKIQEICPYLY